MRDLILFAAIAAIVPLIWRAPVVGLLAWIWVALMNPQREVYGFMSGLQLNLLITAFTVASWLASKERKASLSPMAMVLLAFGFWTCVTTYLALDRPTAAFIWERTIKTLFLAVVAITLVNTKVRMQAVIWMLVAALGYYGVKGGGFVLLTAGRHHVYGPDNTPISDNNQLGLALVVLLPMIAYLWTTSARRNVRQALAGVFFLTTLAVLGTYSRGALVALVASVAVWAVRSRTGVIVLFAGAIAAAALPTVMPQGWVERMSTIQDYHNDDSFEGRVAAWKTAINIAEARPLIGGGFAATEQDWITHAYHSEGSLWGGKAAHSIYFEVLGEHGFLGLALYLAIPILAWVNTMMVLAATRGRQDMAWANQLARMFQISIVAFLLGGAALSMAYYDGFLVILALTASLWQIVRQPAGATAVDSGGPRWKMAADTALEGAR